MKIWESVIEKQLFVPSHISQSVVSALFLLQRHAETTLPDGQRNKSSLSQELPVLWVTSYCWLYLLEPGTMEINSSLCLSQPHWRKISALHTSCFLMIFFPLEFQNVVKGLDQMCEEFGHYQLLLLMSIWKSRRHSNWVSLLEARKEFFVTHTVLFKI